MKFLSCTNNVIVPNTSTSTAEVSIIGLSFRCRSHWTTACPITATIRAAVAAEMSPSLYAMKNATTGRKSRNNCMRTLCVAATGLYAGAYHTERGRGTVAAGAGLELTVDSQNYGRGFL